MLIPLIIFNIIDAPVYGFGLLILSTWLGVSFFGFTKSKKNTKNDLEKIFKILKAKITEEKTIELSSSANGKIIADNQDKIIEKLKTLIGEENLKAVKIEILKKNDSNISTTPQKIIIKLTKNKISKEIEDFLVKKKSVVE